MAGVKAGCAHLCGWQVTLCDPICQVTLRSCEMDFHKQLYTALPLPLPLLSAGKWLQNEWPWMTLSAYFVSKSAFCQHFLNQSVWMSKIKQPLRFCGVLCISYKFAILGRHAQLTRCFSAVAELLVIIFSDELKPEPRAGCAALLRSLAQQAILPYQSQTTTNLIIWFCNSAMLYHWRWRAQIERYRILFWTPQMNITELWL